jgi:predicted CxxxxCH...CXXCH cytochrome family protein
MILITLENKMFLFFGMYSKEQAGLSKKFLIRLIIPLVLLLFLSGCSDSLPDGLPDNIPATGECTVCHGSADNAAPPLSISDSSLTSDIAVGAHQTHMKGGAISAALACGSCHTVPQTVDQPGHRNGLPAEIVWSSLAQTGDLTPVWNRATATCSAVYCHGATLSGGTLKNPVWTVVNSTQNACGTCHGNPPPSPHEDNSNCYLCHPGTVKNTGEIDVAGGKHINGVLESAGSHPDGWAEPAAHGYGFYDTPADCKICHGGNLDGGTSGVSCNACHTGGAAWRTDCTYCHGGLNSTNGAPPYGLRGETAVTNRVVGAHTAHLTSSPSHTAWACSVCHTVPGSFSDAGHIDGVAGAEVHFSSPAGGSSTYTRSTASCSSLYCHGNGRTVSGAVSWTSSTDLTCRSCHGYYTNASVLSGRHNKHISEDVTCYTCHKTVINNSDAIMDKTAHINGSVNVSLTTGTFNASTKTCSSNDCHESEDWYD